MLLLTITHENDFDEIIEGIYEMKEYLNAKKNSIGISESINDNTHFVKIFTDDKNINERFMKNFDLLAANMLYRVFVLEFYKKDMQNFLSDNYFFLKFDEINEMKKIAISALLYQGPIIDDDMIYILNRKNIMTQKIIECFEENREININGFITFRMKEFREDIESILDRVVERFMSEKEYNEFINLLKYFVEIQESKIDELNIFIEKNGEYVIKDKKGIDISEEILNNTSEARFTATANLEDLLMSSLITNAPQKIVFHCIENCTNNELIETIKNVFQGKVYFCESCKQCKNIKSSMKLERKIKN